MRIFVSYKSQDIDEVRNIIEQLREISPDTKVSMLRQSPQWKRIARPYLKKSDIVIYLAGREYSDNIDWEINTALRLKRKVYCIKLADDIELDTRLYQTDAFDDGQRVLKIQNPSSLEEIRNLIKGDRTFLRDRLFDADIRNDEILLEQYKLMLSTSESLIERRQKLTTTYLSIFSALLPVVTLTLSLDYDFLYPGTAIICCICIILCFSWRSAIISYGKSNQAKFAILEEMEKTLPVSMFASEWLARKKISSKYVSFTSHETMIPVLFVFVYAVFLAISIFLWFRNGVV